MKKYLLVLVALTAIVSWGCRAEVAQQTTTEQGHSHADGDHDHGDGHDHDGHDHGPGHDHSDGDKDTYEVAAYCGSCGQAAGTEACCKEDTAKCEKCNMHKGAPLCCKLEGDFAGKKLCGKCGQVAGTEDCCKEGADKCAKCTMHKGAPLCCKLEAKGGAHDEHGDDESHAPAKDADKPADAPTPDEG